MFIKLHSLNNISLHFLKPVDILRRVSKNKSDKINIIE